MISTGHLRYARSAAFSSRWKSRAHFDHLAALLAPDRSSGNRQWPLRFDDDAASIGAEEIDEADDATEADDEADDNIEDDPDIRVTAN